MLVPYHIFKNRSDRILYYVFSPFCYRRFRLDKWLPSLMPYLAGPVEVSNLRPAARYPTCTSLCRWRTFSSPHVTICNGGGWSGLSLLLAYDRGKFVCPRLTPTTFSLRAEVHIHHARHIHQTSINPPESGMWNPYCSIFFVRRSPQIWCFRNQVPLSLLLSSPSRREFFLAWHNAIFPPITSLAIHPFQYGHPPVPLTTAVPLHLYPGPIPTSSPTHPSSFQKLPLLFDHNQISLTIRFWPPRFSVLIHSLPPRS